MKKLTKLIYPLSFLMLFLVFAGCNKLSDEEMVTDHPWTWKEMTTTSDNETLLSFIALTNALMTNATFEFSANGTYTLTALNNTESGTWQMIDDDTFMMDTDEMTIVKLTKDDFIVRSDETDSEYGTYSVTIHLIR
jgi:hypothetical protein